MSDLMELAAKIEADGLVFARMTQCTDPWYKTAARDMAAAADCFAVATALRARAAIHDDKGK